jgi:hypothetical protein
MAIATVANDIASQIEFVRPEVPVLSLMASRLWKLIGERTDVELTSDRPARIPVQPLTGNKFRSGTLFDGNDMGQGSGPVQAFGTLPPVSFLQCTQYTALAEWSTSNRQQAVANYVEEANRQATETFAGYVDASLQGNGSNNLDTVVSTGVNSLVVNNANFFLDNQDVDGYSSLTGAAGFLGTVTVQSVDILNNTIWLTGPVPAGFGVGTLLLISGSPGIANSGIYGLRYLLVGGNAGSLMGIQRSAFPGKFSTPTISVNGSLTPGVVRTIESLVELCIGSERADALDLRAHCNVDMRLAWENLALLVQRVVMNEVKGDQSVDMLKRRAPTEIAGRPMVVNERAAPGIIDFIAFKNLFRTQVKPVDLFEVGGQTIFPSYGLSGGLASSMMFYYVVIMQLGESSARAGATLNSVTVPRGLFGH